MTVLQDSLALVDAVAVAELQTVFQLHHISQDATGSGALFCLYVNIGCDVYLHICFYFIYIYNIARVTYYIRNW